MAAEMSDEELFLAHAQAYKEVASVEVSGRTLSRKVEKADAGALRWLEALRVEMLSRGLDFTERTFRLLAPKLSTEELEENASALRRALGSPGISEAEVHQGRAMLRICQAELLKRAAMGGGS